MRKFILTLAFCLTLFGFASVPMTLAKDDPQIRVTIGRQDDRARRRAERRHRRGMRYESLQTRYVWSGRRLYKEVYRVRYFANGKVKSTLISRVRVR